MSNIQNGEGEPVKTLRDEMAMAALAHPYTVRDKDYAGTAPDIAEWAYSMADAMLAARQKGGAV